MLYVLHIHICIIYILYSYYIYLWEIFNMYCTLYIIIYIYIYIYNIWLIQVWILSENVRQKYWDMSDESCIITDTVAKLKNIFVNCRRLKVQKYSVSIGFSYSDRSSYEHSNEQFAYAVFLYSKPYDVFEQKDIPIFVFFSYLGLLWKHFICYYVALNTSGKHKPSLAL